MSSGTAAGPRASGWVSFVMAYLAVGGVLNLAWGASALADRKNFAEDELVWLNLDTWGAIALLMGLFQLGGAALVWTRKPAAPAIVAFIAFLALMVNFMSIGAYPLWSAVLLALDALILWAATVHSDQFD